MNSFILLGLSCTVGGYLIGVFIGVKRAIKAEERADRYLFAVLDVDRWCGHPFPAARIIARHLKAIGEGLPINAGTPCGEEACTVMGLRHQLTRAKEQQAANSDRSNQGEEARPACYILPSALEWMREIGKVSTRLHASPTAVTSLALYTRPPAPEAVELDAARYRKLRRWMGSNVPEGWQQIEHLGAVCAWMGWDEMDAMLDDMPECNVGLAARAELCQPAEGGKS